jgi:tripartite-type tricarboxylate transporter receptor subunit TctC
MSSARVHSEHQFASCMPLSAPALEISRRQFMHLAAGAAALPTFTRIASGQGYPSRPVRIIVGFPPGGAADITARLLGQWLSGRLGQPFVIENRPGAGTSIGTEAVAKAPADGYTLLLVSVANTVNATLYEWLNFDFIRDIAPVAGIIRGPLVMELHARENRFGAAGNLNKMHAPDTLRITHIDPPVVSNFIQTPSVNERILLEASHTLG